MYDFSTQYILLIFGWNSFLAKHCCVSIISVNDTSDKSVKDILQYKYLYTEVFV